MVFFLSLSSSLNSKTNPYSSFSHFLIFFFHVLPFKCAFEELYLLSRLENSALWLLLSLSRSWSKMNYHVGRLFCYFVFCVLLLLTTGARFHNMTIWGLDLCCTSFFFKPSHSRVFWGVCKLLSRSCSFSFIHLFFLTLNSLFPLSSLNNSSSLPK